MSEPLSLQDRLAISERIDRNAKMAKTYLDKACFWLSRGKQINYVPTLYWDLLEASLDAALEILEALPDDFFESTTTPDYFGLGAALGLDPNEKHNSSDDPLERAQKVIAAIERRRGDVKKRRRIAALENVEGRTPEEAQLYLDKAAELRKDTGT